VQFMVIRRDAASAGAPSAGASLDAALRDAGVLRLTVDLASGADGARLALSPEGAVVTPAPFADGGGVAGFSVFEAGSKDAAVDLVRRWATANPNMPMGDVAGSATFELRETGCPGGCPTVLQPDAAEAGHRYVILLRSNAMTESDGVPPQAFLDTLNAFNERQARAGVLLAGDGLKSTARGARVRLGVGGAQVMDGPFTEAKELIAGFWMFRAPSLEAAIDWAKRVPYPTGPVVEVELRQVAAPAVIAPAAITLDELRADGGLRAEQLDAALRAELAAPPAWR
jgi:hypothetical protein